MERIRDGTEYFRFNPPDIDVGTMEPKAEKLVDMMYATKCYLSKIEEQKKLEAITHLLSE